MPKGEPRLVSRSVLESRAGQGKELACDTEIDIEDRTVIAIKNDRKSADIEDEGIYSISTEAKPGARLNRAGNERYDVSDDVESYKDEKTQPCPILWTNKLNR
ncbi:hypothetical protein EVAR_98037_1 [Eumeta japonica]|uniref:Uncharacterized protein n=1 Tax=Eumeta variegata TaxID=151549 RepID=A0A4C1ZUE6_EUMVA|nr:hypothetical protein EVAR_98050_1 [Eumeta japonica]GBP91620.1 hypothetical protein EVAR_98037_1 [Eumeta japonica]